MKRAFSLAGCLMAFLVIFMTGCADKNGGSTPVTPIIPALIAPTVTLTAPARAETGVPTNSSLIVNFSHVMDRSTITASSFRVIKNDGTILIPGTLTFDTTGKIVTFKPTSLSGFETKTTYTATINTAVKDQAGTAMEAEYNWNFITAATVDTTKPIVIATSAYGTTGAISGAIDLPVNRDSVAVFDKPMDPLTITAKTFIVTGPGLTDVPGVVSLIGTIATFNPTNSLAAGTLYTSTITTGAKDIAGNALAAYVWTWTTASAGSPVVLDTTPPTVKLTSPVDLALNVPINQTIKATFSEDMKATTMITSNFTVKETSTAVNVPGTVTYNAISKIATFLPNNILKNNTKYTATVTNGATDLAGNALVVPAAGLPKNPWTFTTIAAEVLPPVVSKSQLASAATFGIMATSAITNTGAGTMINGDVSMNPGSSIDLLPVQVNGTIHLNDAVSVAARADLLSAYNYYTNLPPGVTITAGADLGALYPASAGGIPPGTYTSGSSMSVATPLVLNAGGNPNAVWVFQIGSSLTTNTPLGNVTLLGGANPNNVFWVCTASATIGVNTTFSGTIIAGVSATGQTGATINGRILAGAVGPGTIALDTNTVNVPAP